MLAAALLSLLLAQDPDPAAAAESEIERARVLIVNLNEEQALEVLAPVTNDEGLNGQLRSRAFVYAGIAHFNVGAEPKAHQDFRLALQQDSGATLPEWVSRRVRLAFELEVKAMLRPPPRIEVAAPPAPVPVLIPSPTVVVAPVRPRWIPVAFSAGLLVSATFTTVGFSQFADQYARAKSEPVALDAQRMDHSAHDWLAVGGVAIATATLCVAGLLWWWLDSP